MDSYHVKHFKFKFKVLSCLGDVTNSKDTESSRWVSEVIGVLKICIFLNILYIFGILDEDSQPSIQHFFVNMSETLRTRTELVQQ